MSDLKRHKSIEISVPVIDQLVKHTHMYRNNVVKRETLKPYDTMPAHL